MQAGDLSFVAAAPTTASLNKLLPPA
jgi:hypothetical protein